MTYISAISATTPFGWWYGADTAAVTPATDYPLAAAVTPTPWVGPAKIYHGELTVGNPTLVVGDPGTSIHSLDTTGNYNTDSGTSLDITAGTGLSMQVVAKLDSIAAEAPVLDWWETELGLSVMPNGAIRLQSSGYVPSDSRSAPGLVVAGTPYQFTLTADFTTFTAIGYLNGVEVVRHQWASDPTWHKSGVYMALFVSYYYNGTMTTASGYWQHWVLWDKVLTPTDVANMAAAGSPFTLATTALPATVLDTLTDLAYVAPDTTGHLPMTAAGHIQVGTTGKMRLFHPDGVDTTYSATPPPTLLSALSAVEVIMGTPTVTNGRPTFPAPTIHLGDGGRFQIIATAYGSHTYTFGGFSVTIPTKTQYDITNVRDAWTKINSYSSTDPFGSATAELEFPTLTGYDGPASLPWLDKFTDIDIYWVPLVSDPTGWIVGQSGRYSSPGTDATRYPVWAGFIASLDVRTGESGIGITAQCQGALFQLDRYTQKPWYPPRPWSMEGIIDRVFLKTQDYQFHLPLKADLRVDYLGVTFPVGWTKTFSIPKPPAPDTPYDGWMGSYNYWTGFTSRNTGDWSKCLTGYVQQLLALMYVQDGSGVTAGNQWTINTPRIKPHVSVNQNNNPLRLPEMYVRERFNPFIHFDLWLGTPGADVQLTEDSTQFSNVVYGEGVGTDGTVWNNANITFDGSVTNYTPLAIGPSVTYVNNAQPSPGTSPGGGSEWDDSYYYSPAGMISEAYYRYGSNLDHDAGIVAATKAVARDADPGWAGTITLKIDVVRNLWNTSDPRFIGPLYGTTVTQVPPFYDETDLTSTTIPRFRLRAGMVMRLLGWQGDLVNGIVLHIAEVNVSPEEGTVTLKVDSRFRDLLTLEEALARTRDPLTPSKMLQVNKRTGIVEDNLAPWSYTGGSGFITRDSVTLHKSIPATAAFPYESYTRLYPPSSHPSYYVYVPANQPSSYKRWSAPFPILMSAKGSIRRLELAAYDRYGNVVPVEFHFSFYYAYTTAINVPHDLTAGTDLAYSPFRNGAWYDTQPTGQPWPPASVNPPPAYMIGGWGNYDQRAGHSPGLSSDGYPATGLLIDDGGISFDFTTNELDFDRNAAKPGLQPSSAITAWGLIYAKYPTPLYFHGRMFRQEFTG